MNIAIRALGFIPRHTTRRWMATALVTGLVLIGRYARASSGVEMTVVPVADVWSEPALDSSTLTPDKRETQLLYGERVIVHQSSGEWLRIEAIEQPAFRYHDRWEGYPGWVSKKAIGFVQSGLLPGNDTVPEDILKFAEETLGTPYLWGGLSKKDGLDCSGLVHLAYRMHRVKIPRDAFEQWMKSKNLSRSQLKPADLIFSAKADHPKKITHVALYLGDGQLIEAPQTGMVVRTISFKEKFGRDLSTVESGDKVGNRVIYFGRPLPS